MKKPIYTLILATAILALAACTKDPCKNTICLNGAPCVEGTCECPVWYEGPDCGTETRAKFYGFYVGTITGGGQTNNSSLTLEPHTDVQRIRMDGTNYMVVVGPTQVEIPLQNIYYQGATYSIEGAGSLSGSQIALNFVMSYQGTPMVFNFTGTK